ncbi:MAG: hypothetical protein JWO31_3592 [Phycisphaerales bacterium]|nr:hypothetical protein [Phycisphaerales bacterium]
MSNAIADVSDAIDRAWSKHESSWEPGYRHFPAVIRAHGLITGAEIGVAFGGHAEAMLSTTDIAKLYAVDSYRHRAGYDDPMNLPQDQFDALYARTVERLGRFGNRFEPVRLDSVEAAHVVPDGLDFVYIDADHSYEGALGDLQAWAPKIREGGVVAGHDYGHPAFPGVRRAVDQYFDRFGWAVNVEGDGVWWVKTHPLPVTFIIPAYNCQSTVAAAVESIVGGGNLTADDEIVVVNDASSDGTADVLAGLAVRFAAVRVLTHARNKGGGAARNTAVEAARHPLIFCLDADNLLSPNSVGPLRRFLYRSGEDVAAFESIRFFDADDGRETHEWVYSRERWNLASYLAETKVPGASGNYLFTRESWARAGGYPEFAGALDTWGFGLRQVATGSRIVVLRGSHYRHRQGHDSYWVRHGRANVPSLSALQVLIPFLHMIRDSDVGYLMGRGRNNWFERVAVRPLRVKREYVDGGTDRGEGNAPPAAAGPVARCRRAAGRIARRLGVR